MLILWVRNTDPSVAFTSSVLPIDTESYPRKSYQQLWQQHHNTLALAVACGPNVLLSVCISAVLSIGLLGRLKGGVLEVGCLYLMCFNNNCNEAMI